MRLKLASSCLFGHPYRFDRRLEEEFLSTHFGLSVLGFHTAITPVALQRPCVLIVAEVRIEDLHQLAL